MAYIEKESKKEWVCVYVWLIHFAIQQKITQPCKLTILQHNFFKVYIGNDGEVQVIGVWDIWMDMSGILLFLSR